MLSNLDVPHHRFFNIPLYQINVVHQAGFEPARISSYAPQAYVSAIPPLVRAQSLYMADFDSSKGNDIIET